MFFGHWDASIKIFKNDALYSDFHSDTIYINKSTHIELHYFHNLFSDRFVEDEYCTPFYAFIVL